MKFFINFFKKNKIKILIFMDLSFINFLNFFKKLNIITCGFINFFITESYFNYPIFLLNNNVYNSYFLYNITYDLYLISVIYKYNIIFKNFFKNFIKLNKLIYLI